MNVYSVLVAALIPMIIGFIWYNPKVLGKAWQLEAGLSDEKVKNPNMVKMMGFMILGALLYSWVLQFAVVHQYHIFSALLNPAEDITNKTTATGADLAAMMDKYGNNYRTFKHGMLHGFIAGLGCVFAPMMVNAIYEFKSWKYIFITAGYWVVCSMLMGGVISAWK